MLILYSLALATIFFTWGWFECKLYYQRKAVKLRIAAVANARKAIGGKDMKAWVVTGPGALSATNLQIPQDIPDTTAQVPAHGGQGAKVDGRI